MASPQLARLIEGRERIARFLWMGLTLPIIVYAGLALAIAPPESRPGVIRRATRTW